MGIRLTDCSCHCHCGMPGQGFFDERRINIVAAPDDQIFCAPCNEEVTVGINPAKIASSQESLICKQADILGWIGICLSDHDARVRDTNLSDLVHVAFARDVAISVDRENAHIRIGEGQANRANFFITVGRVAGHKAGGLGQPISLDNGGAGGVFKPFIEFDGQRR